ncbi:MAG: FlgD immunoglobulin-like domain containing protein [Candidatus Latescibacteria bacterium]|jgi:hypothetical protein|nr:FlgD immunoglobulin-like domain containing protein [Candidatus Latescibacterota bacterium]
MSRVLLVGAALMLLAAPVMPNENGSEAPVRCGTRWLQQQRAAGRFPLPDVPPSGVAKLGQDTTAIQVGTELQFPAAGMVSTVTATCQHVGEHAYIFVENRHWDTNGGSILQSHVDVLGDLFDHSTPADPERGVYDIETEVFGDPADVDGDPRIYILVHEIKFGTGVVGLFDAAVARHAVPEFRRDILFIDERFLRRSNYLTLGTLAHEFQHLIHWRWDEDEDTWVDEGLSGYAEELVGFPEADPNAVPEFLKRPDTSLTEWGVANEARQYGVTYLFMSFLAQRYGNELIREIVAQPRNGIEGLDAALEARSIPDRFGAAWETWAAGSYASQDERYMYGALDGRRVKTFDVEPEQLPLANAPGFVGRWGMANVLFRTPGDLLINFDGDDVGRYRVWTYSMGPMGASLRPIDIDAENRGVAQLTGIDSAVVIVTRTSQQGQNFQLSARRFTPTAVMSEAEATPAATVLAPAFPNPFNSSVRIPYVVATAGDVDLVIYDMLGQRIRFLARGNHDPGRYEVAWDGLDATGRTKASGTYLARLKVGGDVHVTTLSLIR